MALINVTFIQRNHEVKNYLRRKTEEVKIKGKFYSIDSPEIFYTRRLGILVENVFVREGMYSPLKVSDDSLYASEETVQTINKRAFALSNLQSIKRTKTEMGITYALVAALITETVLMMLMTVGVHI